MERDALLAYGAANVTGDRVDLEQAVSINAWNE
jgi:hypothetical protein